MFDIGWSELVVIGVVALIAIGPKELPGVLRTVGQYMGKIRRMASEFQGQFQEAMREAEMADLKKPVDEMTDTAKGFTDFDPLGDVQQGGRQLHRRSAGDAATPPTAAAEALRRRRRRRARPRRSRLTPTLPPPARPTPRSRPKRRSRRPKPKSGSGA